LMALAAVYDSEGDTDQALVASKQAVALIEKTLGPEHPDYANALTGVGVMLSEAKRYNDALNYHRRAEAVAVNVSGPSHPSVAVFTANAAEALNSLRRFDEARVASHEAARILRLAGSPGFFQGFALT